MISAYYPAPLTSLCVSGRLTLIQEYGLWNPRLERCKETSMPIIAPNS